MSTTVNDFGEPIQILKLNPFNSKYELDIAKLKQIFLHKELENVILSVVSIAGAFRKGKSFLLGFFLRYLNVYYNDIECTPNSKWLNDESFRLSGFKWRGGSERHTTGIWIWSKVYTKIMANGQRIGIVLMDTQGTFDNESSMSNNVMIFALSTMLSSIQIYNLSGNIQEDDLQHLQLFTEYGKMVAKQNKTNSKPFQQIMFLIRDWSCPYEYEYGLIGGRKKLLKVLETNDVQPLENQSVRKHLRSCVDEITCFLMPSPGEQARTSKHFDGQLSDLAPEFVEQLKVLVPFLLKPTNVMRDGLKKIQNEEIDSYSFCNLIQQYWKVFERGTLPTPKNILTATTEFVCLSAKSEAFDLYYNMITFYASKDNDIDVPEIINIHKNLSEEAINIYNKKAIMGDNEICNHYRQELKNCIQDNLLYFIGLNQSTKTKSIQEAMSRMAMEIEQLRRIDNSDYIKSLEFQLQNFMKNEMLQAAKIKEIEQKLEESQSMVVSPVQNRFNPCIIM